MSKLYLVYRYRDSEIVQSCIGQLTANQQHFQLKLNRTHYRVLLGKYTQIGQKMPDSQMCIGHGILSSF